MAARTIPIQFSYKVEYIERRHRNSDILRIACNSLIVVDEADEQEAPAICRIEQRDCWEREVTFHVRSHKDVMWWPAGGRDGPLSVSEFVTGIGEGNAYHLGLLSGTLSPPRLARYQTESELFERIMVRKLVRSDQDQATMRAQKGAADLLFCGGLVHIRGGVPVICLKVFGDNASQRASISIIDSSPVLSAAFNCPRPLAHEVRRFEVHALEGHVFRLDEMNEARAAVRYENAVIEREAVIDILMQPSTWKRAFDMQIGAVFQSLTRWISLYGYPGGLPNAENLKSLAPVLFSMSSNSQARPSVDAISMMHALEVFISWCDENETSMTKCRGEYLAVNRALRRIRGMNLTPSPTTSQPLHPEDDQALSDMGKSR